MTQFGNSEDDLIEKLAALSDSGQAPLEPTLASIHEEIDTLELLLRQLPERAPFLAEPQLARALEKVARLAAEESLDPTTRGVADRPLRAPDGVESLGQYELHQELGAGGMGAVYKAVHRKLNRTVALKVLPADRFQSAAAVARFEREMQAVGMLQHPNIVAAHDAGEVDGRHFLVMEYVEGIDVAQLLARVGPLPIAEACEITRQAALGLQHIHENGLVHRDIKPSNLMLAFPRHRQGRPTVKILDLGLALLDTAHVGGPDELTSTGQVMGTIHYMAPEQGRDTHRVDIRADLYSLGAALYKLLTGRAPLEDPRYDSVMKRLIALERDHPPALNTLRPDCPQELSALVERLLSKLPEDRPQDPQTVVEALAPFAEGASLQRLLDASGVAEQRRPLSASRGGAVADTRQRTPISAPRSAAARERVTRPRRRWLLAAMLPVVVLLGAVIYIATDKGTVTIEAPDDLQGTISVSVVRNGVSAVDNWIIKPGRNEHRVRTGAIEVRVSAAAGDEFELEPPGDLVVRRNGTVAYRLLRRPPREGSAAVAAAPTPALPEEILEQDAIAPELEEPPILEEWLKGRTILTVAQDGSGQFATIQAALDALEPGQVVKVLDQGPYRESLRLDKPPADIGLISDQRTILELSNWEIGTTNATSQWSFRWGHQVHLARGLRISGLRMLATTDATQNPHQILMIRESDGVVIEDCGFAYRDEQRTPHLAIEAVGLRGFGSDVNRCCVIRDCVSDGGKMSATCYTGALAAPILFTRNLIRPWTGGNSILVQGWVRKVGLYRNVLVAAPPSSGIEFILDSDNTALELIDIVNNTVVGVGVNAFHFFAPASAVKIRGNVLSAFRLANGAQNSRAVIEEWQIAGNWYHVRPESHRAAEDLAFRRPADPSIEPKFLSENPNDLNFARIPAGAGIAAAGALPPGPAPREGDWFTKLCERWADLKRVPMAESTE